MNYELILKFPSWLIALAVVTAVLHLTLLDLADEQNLLSISFLCWLAIASLIWDKRHKLSLDNGIFSTVLGMTLIAVVLLRSISPAGYHLQISPFISGVGLCLIASGIKQIKQYWKELLILALLALYSLFAAILQGINLPILTAKFTNFVLWLAGFNSYRQGVFIHLPKGSVEVYGSCSGIDSIILMLIIAILFLLLFPMSKLQGLIAITIAVLLGFMMNSIRVGVMALLVAYSQPESFKYWHGDDGSLIFAMVSVFIFGCFCWFAYIRNQSLPPKIN